MNKYILGLVVIIVLAGAGWYAWSQRAIAPASVQNQQAANTDPQVSAAAQMLAGTWGSEEDSTYFLQFNADGTMVDRSGAGEGGPGTVKNGTYTLFTARMPLPPDVTFQLNNNDVYVAEVVGAETYHYRISMLSPTQLELVYMERGGTLRFAKVQ